MMDIAKKTVSGYKNERPLNIIEDGFIHPEQEQDNVGI